MSQFEQAMQNAFQSGNIDEMVNLVKSMVQANPRLSAEQRNMLYAAYKAATGKRRAALQTNPNDGVAARELEGLCSEVLTMLASLIPIASDAEEKTFYFKFMADFYRYYDEVRPNNENKKHALECYQSATDWANQGLSVFNPLRLNVALNFGVYYQDTTKDTRTGLQMTLNAIDAARPVLPSLDERAKAEASFVLSLLMDNAKLWSKEIGVQEPPAIQGMYVPPVPQGGDYKAAQQQAVPQQQAVY